MLGVANRNNHSAAFSELSKERLRNRRGRSGDKNGVKRCKFLQPQGAVAAMHVDVGVTEPLKPRRRRQRQRRAMVEAEYFSGQAREDRRLVTAARSDFKHAVVWPQLKRCRHRGNDIGLRNGLAVTDGQWHIIVSPSAKLFRHK